MQEVPQQQPWGFFDFRPKPLYFVYATTSSDPNLILARTAPTIMPYTDFLFVIIYLQRWFLQSGYPTCVSKSQSPHFTVTKFGGWH